MSIRLVTLGVPACHVGNQELADLPAQKARFALLLHIAVERNVSRDEVAALFWPESDEERARHALSQALYELRRLLGEAWVQSHSGRLVVAEDVGVDAREFTRLCQDEMYERAVDLYHGPFLSGFFLSNCKGFESWVDRQRAQLERAHRRARRECVNQLVEAKRLPVALEVARHWVELDPYEDEANHRLIELLTLVGDRTGALREFAVYERRLREDLALEPLENTKRLMDAIRTEKAEPAPQLLLEPAALQPGAASNSPSVAPSTQTEEPAGLLKELLRRRVFRMAVWYGATAFAVIQFVQVMQDAFDLPGWILTAVVVLCIAAFPLGIVLSWHFDLTPTGIKRTQAVTLRLITPRKMFVAAVLVIVSVVGLGTFTRKHVVSATTSLCLVDIQIACSRLDSLSYIVLPFASTTNVPERVADGFLFANALTDNLAQIEGLRTFDQMRVNDVVQRLAARVYERITVDSAILIGRRLGAGRVLLGELQFVGDSIRIVASLYDATSAGAPSRNVRVRIAERNLLSVGPAAVVDSLLATEAGGLPISAGISITAAREFARGEAALAAWNLNEARNHYAAASKLDADYAVSAYRLAQVLMWQRDTSSAFRTAVRTAERSHEQLRPVDQQIVHAMASLAASRHEAACDHYRAALQTDSLNFAAWYGLGDCLAWDNDVIRDSVSPSGYRFKSSYNEAVHAYVRALEIAPSFNQSFQDGAFSRLSRMLFTNPQTPRLGLERATETSFAAFPILVQDTVAFIPYPIESGALALTGVEDLNRAALKRNRQHLRRVVRDWVRVSPGSADAFAALAAALESLGVISSVGDPENSALDALHKARTLEVSRPARVHLQAMEARLLLKLSAFKQARQVADSMIRGTPNPRDDEAYPVAAAQALTGRTHAAARTLEKTATAESVTGVEARSLKLSRRLVMYAAFRAPADSIRKLTRELELEIAATAVEHRERTRMLLLLRPAALSFPLVGHTSAHDIRSNWPLIQLQAHAYYKNAAAVRKGLDEFPEDLESVEADLEHAFILLHLQIGDTARAVRELDRILSDLSSLDSRLMRNPTQSAGLVHLFALRARLAVPAGDKRVARYWARSALALWQNADKELAPVVQELRAISKRR